MTVQQVRVVVLVDDGAGVLFPCHIGRDVWEGLAIIPWHEDITGSGGLPWVLPVAAAGLGQGDDDAAGLTRPVHDQHALVVVQWRL